MLLPSGERGSSPVEFVLVGTMLTAVTLAVVQFGIAVYVRNVVHDAAVSGAHAAALADAELGDGVRRTKEAITRAVGASYADDILVARIGGPTPAIEVTVRTTLPLLGLLGAPAALEVVGRAPVESFDAP